MKRLLSLVVFGLILLGGICIFTPQAYAATYIYDTGVHVTAYVGGTGDNGLDLVKMLNITIIGHNTTHGCYSSLPFYLSEYIVSQPYYYPNAYLKGFKINYIVPDDGSTWVVQGAGIIHAVDGSVGGPGPYYWNSTFNNTVTTGGSFLGPGLDNVTASISTTDKTAIINGVTGSSILSTINTNASTAATQATTAATKATSAANNTTYNSQTAAYWAYQANTNASSAATAATQATNAATSAANTTPPLYTVIQGVAFIKVAYGDLSGSPSNGISATLTTEPTTGSKYTTFTGTLTTTGITPVIFGGKMVLFNVIAAPTSYPATVSFSN